MRIWQGERSGGGGLGYTETSDLLVEAQHGGDLRVTNGAVTTRRADLVCTRVTEEIVAAWDESSTHLTVAAGEAGECGTSLGEAG